MTHASTNIAARGPRTRPLTTGDHAFLHFTRQNPGEFLDGVRCSASGTRH
ncbi:hypothetical protein [Frankia sp. R82]|nr:hypothetical protein [Frankia sp. R82]MCM3885264.1 hypothetical protein [Frankia sp. R82]